VWNIKKKLGRKIHKVINMHEENIHYEKNIKYPVLPFDETKSLKYLKNAVRLKYSQN